MKYNKYNKMNSVESKQFLGKLGCHTFGGSI